MVRHKRVFPELDGLRLGVDLLTLPGDVLKHLCGHFGQCTEAQALQILGFEYTHVEHVCIVQSRLKPPLGHVPIALWQQTNPGHHIRVITRICSSRCQGRPSTRASNCGCESVIGAAASDASRGHAKRP